MELKELACLKFQSVKGDIKFIFNDAILLQLRV